MLEPNTIIIIAKNKLMYEISSLQSIILVPTQQIFAFDNSIHKIFTSLTLISDALKYPIYQLLNKHNFVIARLIQHRMFIKLIFSTAFYLQCRYKSLNKS